MTSGADKLIYQNSNTYRLHADNLRWTLLGGYAAFLTAIIGLSQSSGTSINISDPIISFLAFLVSFTYLWILAVQNWFYNLFARWVDDCEYHLVDGTPLQTLQVFAKVMGPSISPFHPAFFMAELLVGSVAYFFLSYTIRYATIPWLTPILQNLPPWLAITLWVAGFLLYFAVLNIFFLNWQQLVYEPIISHLSNIYKPVVKGKTIRSKSAQ
jgi:hypothetical protein